MAVTCSTTTGPPRTHGEARLGLLSSLSYATDGSSPDDVDGRVRRTGSRPASPESPGQPIPPGCTREPGATAGGTRGDNRWVHLARRVRRSGRLGPRSLEVAMSSFRTPIRDPVGFDEPQFFGQYRDSPANVFLDGKSNLVLRATKDGPRLLRRPGRMAVARRHRHHLGGPRSRSNCLARPVAGPPGGCPMTTRGAGRNRHDGVVRQRELAVGTTVHANSDGTAFKTHPIARGRRLAHLAGALGRHRHQVLAGLR